MQLNFTFFLKKIHRGFKHILCVFFTLLVYCFNFSDNINPVLVASQHQLEKD